jgi:Peptidase family S41
MRTALPALALAVLALTGSAQGSAQEVSSGRSSSAIRGAAKDVRQLGAELESLHPNLFRNVSRTRFRSEVSALARRAPSLDANQLLVGLMRIAALPGDRNGHTGLFPLHDHRRQLHLYPLRLYDFVDGVHVVDEVGGPTLTGLRLVAVAGVPVAQVLERVRPLVPHDNESSMRALAPHYALVAEVLAGLGLTDGVGPLAFTFERSDGERIDHVLVPIAASEYAGEFSDSLHGHNPAVLPSRPRPLYLAQAGRELYVRKLAQGRVLYVGYNSALALTYEFAPKLERMAKSPRVRRVVVDVRLNGGGNNQSYRPLYGVLASPAINRPGRLYLLVGRATFSAAGNFAAEIDRYTRAVLVGEPTGGGVNQYGDATTIDLPVTGWTVHVATSYVVRGPLGDRRLAVVPSRRVDMRSTDFLAGRDPVLASALEGL